MRLPAHGGDDLGDTGTVGALQHRDQHGLLGPGARGRQFGRMLLDGMFADGTRTLRAKIDMAHVNMLMRDPVLYRIKHAHHHRNTVGEIENVVITNETAILCENNDLKQFSEGLLKIIENDALRASMGKKGWLHVKEKFHFTRLVSDMENLYAKLLKKH